MPSTWVNLRDMRALPAIYGLCAGMHPRYSTAVGRGKRNTTRLPMFSGENPPSYGIIRSWSLKVGVNATPTPLPTLIEYEILDG